MIRYHRIQQQKIERKRKAKKNLIHVYAYKREDNISLYILALCLHVYMSNKRIYHAMKQRISEKIDSNQLYQNVFFYIFITTPLTCFSKATQKRLQNSKYYIYLRNASLPLRYTIIEVAHVHLNKL